MMRILFVTVTFVLSCIATPLNSHGFISAGQTCQLQTDWVPERLGQGGSIVFPASVGQVPATLIVDTGAPVTTIDIGLARRIGLKFHGGEKVRLGANGSLQTSDLAALDIVVAGKELRLESAEAADLSSINFNSETFDIILGRDILNNCAIEINADKNLARVGDRSLDVVGAKRIPLIRVGPSGFPALQIGLAPKTEILAGVDTGSQASLFVDDRAWSRVAKDSIRQTTVVTGSVTGFITEGLAFLSSVSIGPVQLRDVETRIQLDRTTDHQMALIGLGVLSRFNSVIDLRSRYIWLLSRETIAPISPRSTSGVLAVPDRDRLKVVHVMRNSPAEAAGLTDKDQICRIDDHTIPIDYFAQPISIWSRDKPGRVVRLTLCDGTQKQLTLRNFY